MIISLTGGLEPPKNPLIETFKPQQEIVEVVTEHIVSEGENLYEIAKEHDTTIQRIFDKNTDIENPDQIDAGVELVIPDADEELDTRPIPEPIIEPVAAVQAPTRTSTPVAVQTPVVQPVRSSGGLATAPAGWYPVNQCTHHIWSKRPVGRWNNASEWYWQAQRDGWATGLTPQVGAIGVAYGNHVVYIERVDGNRVYVSERNWDFRGSYNERWASASDFRYIY